MDRNACELDPQGWIKCTKNFPAREYMSGRRVELAFASLIQILVYITNSFFVVRCFQLFSDTPLVWVTAALALAGSVGVMIAGLIDIDRAIRFMQYVHPSERGNTWIQAGLSYSNSLPRTYTPAMSIISSVVVNAIVAAAFIWRMRKSSTRPTMLTMILESAVVPVVFGALASIFASWVVIRSKKPVEFELIPKLVWVGSTLLAPQYIILRILQGRDWVTLQGRPEDLHEPTMTTGSPLDKRDSIATIVAYMTEEKGKQEVV